MTEEQRARLEEYKMKREVLDNQSKELEEKQIAATEHLEKNLKEEERVINVAHNAHIIIHNFEDEFEKSTMLDRKDMTFLFFATALQCARWALQPKIDTDFKLTPRDERHDAGEDGLIEKQERNKKVGEIEKDGEASSKYMSIKKMFLYPVPYDAMDGTRRIVIPGVSSKDKNLYGGNHHSATMGHDPILGYLFGTMNIMTRTITFKNPTMQTCEVHLKKNTYGDIDIRLLNRMLYVRFNSGDGFVPSLVSEKREKESIVASIAVLEEVINVMNNVKKLLESKNDN